MNFKIFGYGIDIERIKKPEPEPVLRQLSVDEILAKAKNYISTRYKFCETCGTEKEILDEVTITTYDTVTGNPDSWKLRYWCPNCHTLVYFRLVKNYIFGGYSVRVGDKFLQMISDYE